MNRISPRAPRHRVVALSFLAGCVVCSASAHAEVIFNDGFEFQLNAFGVLVAYEDDADQNGLNDMRVDGINGVDVDQRVNVNASGEQLDPAIAVADNGNFVVAWADDNDGNGAYQILARGFRPDGSELFATITVNSTGAGQQLQPDIAMAPNGDWVAVWMDDNDGNGFGQIYRRGFRIDGSARFPEQTVNDIGAGNQREPSIAIANDGSFVVAWEDDQDNDQIYDISARRFNASGSPRLGQFYVNPVRAGSQKEPDVSMNATGAFVVVWNDDRDLNFFGQIRGSGYASDGSPLFSDITVNTVGAGHQYQPSVALADDGTFVATWVDQGQQIRARAFATNAAGVSGDVVVNDDRFRPQFEPEVLLRADGTYYVVWQSLQGSGNWSIRGRALSQDGLKTPETVFAENRGGDQTAPVAVLP